MKKVAVIAIGSKSNEQGGAERFYQGLVSALNRFDVAARLFNVLSDESNFDRVRESYLRCYDLDLSGFDGVISTKAPGHVIRHGNHVCYLQHTMRVFYDMFEHEFKHVTKELIQQRQLIQAIDTKALQFPKTRKIFVIGREVQDRLLKYNHLESEVLHQTTTMNGFRTGVYDYLFMPGRLHRWKRVDLMIRAMRHVKSDIQLNISGTGEDEPCLRRLAEKDSRIRFLGRISDQELQDYYANALAIPFIPIREDFGLITLEAFFSHKPVITCTDSGEPANIVQDRITGFICTPNPEAIGQKIDWLVSNRDQALRMGEKGYNSIRHISWENTAVKLLDALQMI